MNDSTLSLSPADEAIKDFHQALFRQLHKEVVVHTEQLSEEDQLFVDRMEKLAADINASEDGLPLGQWLITTVVARYPHLTPRIPRDLFWYFGGECLHYVADEEMTRFQALDERFHELSLQGQVPDYQKVRAEFFPD